MSSKIKLIIGPMPESALLELARIQAVFAYLAYQFDKVGQLIHLDEIMAVLEEQYEMEVSVNNAEQTQYFYEEYDGYIQQVGTRLFTDDHAVGYGDGGGKCFMRKQDSPQDKSLPLLGKDGRFVIFPDLRDLCAYMCELEDSRFKREFLRS
jgi:hypothetical protein